MPRATSSVSGELMIGEHIQLLGGPLDGMEYAADKYKGCNRLRIPYFGPGGIYAGDYLYLKASEPLRYEYEKKIPVEEK